MHAETAGRPGGAKGEELPRPPGGENRGVPLRPGVQRVVRFPAKSKNDGQRRPEPDPPRHPGRPFRERGRPLTHVAPAESASFRGPGRGLHLPFSFADGRAHLRSDPRRKPGPPGSDSLVRHRGGVIALHLEPQHPGGRRIRARLPQQRLASADPTVLHLSRGATSSARLPSGDWRSRRAFRPPRAAAYRSAPAARPSPFLLPRRRPGACDGPPRPSRPSRSRRP